LRQLTLDLLIDYFEEKPTRSDLQLKDKGFMAWLPHLGYFSRISPMFLRMEENAVWELPQAHIHDWVESWAIGNHRKFAKAKYGDSYAGESFDDWTQRLETLFADHGAPTLENAGVTRVWAWRAYLSGYQATHIAYVWACSKIKELRQVIYPGLPATKLETVWSVIPTANDEAF
jgi:hypothetical protein